MAKVTRKNFLELFLNGVPVVASTRSSNRHTSVIEAWEHAEEHAQEIKSPGDYEVRVDGGLYYMVKITEIVLDHSLDQGTPSEQGQISLSASSYSGNENSSIQFTILRALNVTQRVRVDWAITNASATPTSGSVTFESGDASKSVSPLAGEVGPTEIGTLNIVGVSALTDITNVPRFIAPVSASFTVIDIDGATDFSDVPGNVLNFGADATGATDSSAALLAAFNSDHAIYIPPGEYKYAATFCNTTKPKLVWCFGERWVQTDVEISSARNNKRLGEQVRFVAAANVDAVNVKSLMSWNGGQFDVKNVLPPNANKSVFNVDMNWLGGQYGGKFWNVSTQSDGEQINQDDVNGWHGVKVNFDTQTVDGARFEGWRVEIEQVKAQDGWRVSAYNPGYNQHSGLHTVNVNYSESYRAYYDESSDNSWFSNLMQTQNGIFNDPAVRLATYAAVVLGPNNVGQDYGVQDFNDNSLTRSIHSIHFGPGNKLELTNAGYSASNNPIFVQPQMVEQLTSSIEIVDGSLI